MELYLDIYETADKGIASNVVLDDQTVLEIQKKVKDAGYPIATMVTYSNMENYESVDSFLKECMEGKRGSVVIYEIHNDGGLGRMKFIFDGTDMYVVSTRGIWNADNKPGISYISYTRLKEWKYTEKGWFCYELCVPEPPEVSEIMDGSCLIRIKPMTGEQCEMSERCVRGLGYQGQNLLCSNWNVENMSELDYNGMFEYLYGMKYGEKFNSEDYPNGIPKEEFESLIMEYLPITAEQIREYAVFDLMLPGLSGEEVLPHIKGIPVIIMSAKVDVDNKVALLLGGAVDYMTKPFYTRELLARIAVHLRTFDSFAKSEILTFEEIKLNIDTHIAQIKDVEIKLTRTEYAILKLLMQNQTQVVSKSHLLDHISEDTPDCTESSLKTHISNLRKKLRAVNGKEYIEAVWGIGFKMKEE